MFRNIRQNVKKVAKEMRLVKKCSNSNQLLSILH